MNYCTKCQSIYSQPGTCNCYAPVRVTIWPSYPYTYPYTSPTTTPWVCPTTCPPFNIGGGSVTVTGMDGFMWNGPVPSVPIDKATGPFSEGL